MHIPRTILCLKKLKSQNSCLVFLGFSPKHPEFSSQDSITGLFSNNSVKLLTHMAWRCLLCLHQQHRRWLPSGIIWHCLVSPQRLQTHNFLWFFFWQCVSPSGRTLSIFNTSATLVIVIMEPSQTQMEVVTGLSVPTGRLVTERTPSTRWNTDTVHF